MLLSLVTMISVKPSKDGFNVQVSFTGDQAISLDLKGDDASKLLSEYMGVKSAKSISRAAPNAAVSAVPAVPAVPAKPVALDKFSAETDLVVIPAEPVKAKHGSGGGSRGPDRERVRKNRESLANIKDGILAAYIDPETLAGLPRPLSHAEAAADRYNMTGKKVKVLEFAKRWGWADSTVSGFLRIPIKITGVPKKVEEFPMSLNSLKKKLAESKNNKEKAANG